jgi:histidinol-phosphate aminotransferase
MVRDFLENFQPPKPPQPAPDGFLAMHDNSNIIAENPVYKKVVQDVSRLKANLYPSPFSQELVDALSKEYGYPQNQIIVGCGTSEIFDLTTKAFINPGDVVAIPSPSFVLPPFFVDVNLGIVKRISLNRGFMLDVEGILKSDAKFIIISSPNNPTGNTFDEDAILEIVKRFDGPVLIDEAYAEFSHQDFISVVKDFENLIVARTFSKAYGLANIRVGYAIGGKRFIKLLYKVKTPFTVSSLSERVAIEALKDKKFMKECVEIVSLERHILYADLRKSVCKPYHTDANFMLIETPFEAQDMVKMLFAENILIWGGQDFPEIKKCIRVTIGKREHNQRFCQTLLNLVRGKDERVV